MGLSKAHTTSWYILRVGTIKRPSNPKNACIAIFSITSPLRAGSPPTESREGRQRELHRRRLPHFHALKNMLSVVTTFQNSSERIRNVFTAHPNIFATTFHAMTLAQQPVACPHRRHDSRETIIVQKPPPRRYSPILAPLQPKNTTTTNFDPLRYSPAPEPSLRRSPL